MIKIRTQIDTDAEAVKSIIAAATDELRSIYRPIKTKVQNKIGKPISLVATIKENVVGSAEYFICENSVLVRGLAVSPVYRKRGVARAIIEHIILRAQKEGKAELVLSTIKETRNTNAFLHMGFTVVSEMVSEIFVGIQGEQVTVVNMRKNGMQTLKPDRRKDASHG